MDMRRSRASSISRPRADGGDRTRARAWRVGHGLVLPIVDPIVMGILNVTPDSFSDGGAFASPIDAVRHAMAMFDQGATIVDIGGESTRPGARPVPVREQLRRVEPVVAGVVACLHSQSPTLSGASRAAAIPLVLSIDTTSSAVAAAALDAGAHIVNDVSAGRDDTTLFEVVAARSAGLVLMHRLVAPSDDSYSDRYGKAPSYSDVVADVGAFLAARVDAAMAAGVSRDAIAIDPGLGFGKSVEQNFELIARLDDLCAIHPIVLVGASRKSFVGAATATADPTQRLPGSLAAAVAAVLRGAAIVRVHDVAATRQAIAVAHAVSHATPASLRDRS